MKNEDSRRRQEATTLFDRADRFEISGRKAVHWSELTQLAPYTVGGLTAKASWGPAGEHFPLARLLEEESGLFVADLNAVLGSGIEWGYEGITPEIIESGSWTSFPLLQNTEWDEKHCAVAVNICRLLRDRPELMGRPPRYIGDDTNKNTSVMIAKLTPGTHLRSHTGGHNTQISLHLGLAGLDGAVISVGLGDWSSWTLGKVKAFDDSYIHEVWHNGTSDRYVLIAFVWHPEYLAKASPTGSAAAAADRFTQNQPTTAGLGTAKDAERQLMERMMKKGLGLGEETSPAADIASLKLAQAKAACLPTCVPAWLPECIPACKVEMANDLDDEDLHDDEGLDDIDLDAEGWDDDGVDVPVDVHVAPPPPPPPPAPAPAQKAKPVKFSVESAAKCCLTEGLAPNGSHVPCQCFAETVNFALKMG